MNSSADTPNVIDNRLTMATSAPPSSQSSSRRRLFLVALTAIAAVTAVVAVFGLNQSRLSFEERTAQTFAVGDCVVVPTAAPNVVRAARSSCAVDPSYTIGATTTAAGECPSAEYQRFPAPAADEPTAALCLVPNLIADHCYELQMPVGVVTRADCTVKPDDPDVGVLVQINQRIDKRDQGACPTANGHFAWPYPAPARTYCTQTLAPKLVG
jgi:hypothetical protein